MLAATAGTPALAQNASMLLLVEQRAEDGSFEERVTLRCVTGARCLAPMALLLDGRPVATLLAAENLGRRVRLHVIRDLQGRPAPTVTSTGQSDAADLHVRQVARLVREVTLHIVNYKLITMADPVRRLALTAPAAELRVTVTLE